MVAVRHLGFFYWLTVCRRWSCITVQNFVEIGQSVAEISRFFDFSRCRQSAILDLLCACLDHKRSAFGGLYHCAKFGWNRCSSFDDMHFFDYASLAWKYLFTCRHVGFSIFKILTVGRIKRVNLRHGAKFRGDRSKRCRLVAIFRDGGRRHLGFLKFEFFTVEVVKGQPASQCQISWRSVKPLLRYGDLSIFQDNGRPASWIWDARVWTTREEYLVVFIAVQNLVGIGVVLLKIIMRVSILCQFGLKMPIHAPFGEFLGKNRVTGNVLQFPP